jgi:hypothetical protein
MQATRYLVNDEEIEGLDDTTLAYEEDDITREDEGEFLRRSLVVRRLLMQSNQREPPQHHNIFKTQCTMNCKMQCNHR